MYVIPAGHTQNHTLRVKYVCVERAVTPRGLPKRGPWRRGASDRRDLSCRVSGTQLKGGGKAMHRSLTATEQATKASKTTFRVTRVSSEKQCSRKTLESLQDEKGLCRVTHELICHVPGLWLPAQARVTGKEATNSIQWDWTGDTTKGALPPVFRESRRLLERS